MLRKKLILSNLITYLIMITIFMFNLSQLPYFVELGMTQMISMPFWMVLILSLLTNNSFKIHRSFIEFFILSGIFLSTIGFFSIIKSVNYFTSSLVYSLIISIAMYVTGVLISPLFSKDLFRGIIITYSISVLIVSISIFIRYFGLDFSLGTAVYQYRSKNSFSQNILNAVILLYYGYTPKNKIQNIFKIFVIIFGLFMIIVLRSRATILSLIFILICMLFSGNLEKKYKRYILLSSVILTIILIVNEELRVKLVYNVIMAGRDVNDLDSLSSGRITIIKSFPSLIGNNWITGIGPLYYECFPISAILQFGLIAGSMLIIISLIPFIKSVYQRNNKVWEILFFLSMGYLINSLFEGLAPFGPGIKCYILWLLYGILNSPYNLAIFEDDNDYGKRKKQPKN